MKQLLAGVVLIIVLGTGAFLYRNVMERPNAGIATTPGQGACSLDAKVCPDGTSVGRSGPNCTFAACPPPNVADAALGISYAVPSSYQTDAAAVTADPSIHAAYSSQVSATQTGTLLIRSYPLSAGEMPGDAIVANTMYQSSGLMAKSLNEFKEIPINGKNFYAVTIDQSEGHVRTVYYLPQPNDVLRFEAADDGVLNWNDPNLDVSTLPAHQALLSMLATLQTN